MFGLAWWFMRFSDQLSFECGDGWKETKRPCYFETLVLIVFHTTKISNS